MRLFALIRNTYTNSPSKMSEASLRTDNTIKFAASIMMAVASLGLTLMNVVNRYWFMAGTTTILFVGFLICALLCKVFKKRLATEILMGVLIALIFSVYAVTGENEGFAILWILLVPPLGMSLIGLNAGTILSLYFQFFLILLFYTPMRNHVADHYTNTFCVRFPVLYLTTFATSLLIFWQKEFYHLKIEQAAFYDSLTGINNRRQYDAAKDRICKKHLLENITFVSIDINRLKYTNDTYGHMAGDALIIGSADCITKCFGNAETICRIGGDEFAIITYQPKETVLNQIDRLVALTRDWSCEYFSGISLSVGYSFQCDHPEYTMIELEKAADQAMYRAKADFYIRNGLDRRQQRHGSDHDL